MYVNLHSHSFYSVLDGYSSPEELAAKAAELELPGMALTDHGTLSGNRDFQKACHAHGVKPILGVEAYISETDRFDRRSVQSREDNTQLYNHLIVIGKDQAGYENLSAMSTKAWSEGYYYKPRIDKELLAEHKDGLIVASGCLNGLIAKALEREDMEAAREHARWFVDTFGEDFYMEIQAHNPSEINNGLMKIAREFDIKPIVTLDCHFTNADDREAVELMLALQTNAKVNKDFSLSKSQKMDFWERINYIYPERPISFEDLDLYVMEVNELADALDAAGMPTQELMNNSVEVLDKIGEYERYEGVSLLPQPKRDAYELLAETVFHELRIRDLDSDEYKERLRSELEVIRKKDFAAYFLIVADIVRHAKSQGIRVGPGRGSAAGSLLVDLLGITKVDPIEHGLLFGRFIDESRNDMPDIDVDFQDERRGEVKDYIMRKFKNTATVSTFTKFVGVGTVKDVARVFRIPIQETEDATKHVDSLEDFYTDKRTKSYREKYPEVVKGCKALQGRIRGVGMHAAGVVVSSEPIDDYAPIEYRKDKNSKAREMVPVVALNKDAVEELGLLKIDTLGLKALTVIEQAVQNILSAQGLKIDVEGVDYADPEVYKMLANGNTRGVFQAEAGPYTALLKKMRPRNFTELAVSTALVRPGAMDTIGEEYLGRRDGVRPVVYANEKYREITEETFGVVVFQEQVMRSMVELAGMSWSDADRVRKIIGKKGDAHDFDEYRDKFVTGCAENGIDSKYAEKLWHDFEAHANYSFNKSHSVAYSMLTYQTAWFKFHYPAEFMAAVLAHETDKLATTSYLLECRRLGIRVLLPDVNRSGKTFTIDGDAIRFGLTNIKYIADAAASVLIDNRPWTSWEQIKEFSQQTGSGLSVRIRGALIRTNAAIFEDHPGIDISEYLYEYLGVPVLDDSWMGPHTRSRITQAIDYDEGDGAILYGMVASIKSKPGATWNRVTMIDETGEASFFTGPDPGVEVGKMYVILAGNNRILDYVDVNEIDTTEKFFAKYLKAKRVDLDKGQYLVVEFNRRQTKAKRWMANSIVVDSSGELLSMLVFPQQFPAGLKHMQPGEVASIKPAFTKDGALFADRIERTQ